MQTKTKAQHTPLYSWATRPDTTVDAKLKVHFFGFVTADCKLALCPLPSIHACLTPRRCVPNSSSQLALCPVPSIHTCTRTYVRVCALLLLSACLCNPWRPSCSTSADWIVDIGPQTYTGQPGCAPCYEYAVVTDPTLISLFVLTRNVTSFKANYDAQVLAKLKTLGKSPQDITTMNAIQKKNCVPNVKHTLINVVTSHSLSPPPLSPLHI